jgi:hypothetical protein
MFVTKSNFLPHSLIYYVHTCELAACSYATPKTRHALVVVIRAASSSVTP